MINPDNVAEVARLVNNGSTVAQAATRVAIEAGQHRDYAELLEDAFWEEEASQ